MYVECLKVAVVLEVGGGGSDGCFHLASFYLQIKIDIIL